MLRILRLIEMNDWRTAQQETAALSALRALSPSMALTVDGLARLAMREPAEALPRFQAAVAVDARNPYAHYWLGAIHAADGRAGDASLSINRALGIDPEMSEALVILGGLAHARKDINAAIRYLLEAIRHEMDNPRYWRKLNQLVARLRIEGPMESARALLLTALDRHKVEFSNLDQVLYTVLGNTTAVRQLFALADAGTLHAEVISGRALHLLSDELLLQVLQQATLQHPGYERLLTAIRRALLEAVAGDAVPDDHRDATLRFTAALATYAVGTEFVFYRDGREGQLLASLRSGLDAVDDGRFALRVCMLGCYELLADGAADIQGRIQALAIGRGVEFQRMVAAHLEEPARIRECMARIPLMGAITNDVSLAVKDQYEENPYPRWRSLGEPQAMTFDNRIARALPHLPPGEQPGLQGLPHEPLDILIAGCGTGRHAIWCAREYPNTHVLAIDLSRTSLAYAVMKAPDFGVTNIDFLQGDLLALPELNRQFDVIESIGVLHHMADPAEGLRALVRCLRPGGWMKVALYSELARGAVRSAWQLITKEGFPRTADGIRRFRESLRTGAPALHALCARWRDFYSLSDCRDLLFHVQEHQFTTEGLAALINGAGLDFMGFEANPGNGLPVRDRRSLAAWGVFERANPDFFAGMYVMWLRRPRAQ